MTNVRSYAATMHASQPVWFELPHKSTQKLYASAWFCIQVLLNELSLLSHFAWETATVVVLWYFSMAGDGTVYDSWLLSAKRFFCLQTHKDAAAQVAQHLDDGLATKVLMQVCPHPLAILVWGTAMLAVRALKWYCSASEADTTASGLCFLVIQDWAISPGPV